jgi:protein-tyrosine kinase
MDIRYLLLILRSRWFFLLACSALFGAAALAVGHLRQVHSATASLWIRAPIVAGDAMQGDPSAIPVATAMEVLASPRVAQRAVEKSGLSIDHPHARRWGMPDDAGVNMQEWLALRLVGEMRFASGGDRNVISITGRSKDRDTAAALANAFAQAYVEVSREVQIEQAQVRIERLQLGLPGIESEVRAARVVMANFRRAHPGFNPDPRGDYSSAVLASLTGRLAQLESEAGRVRDSGNGAAGLSASDGESMGNLLAEARRARSRMSEVSGTFGPNHPAHESARRELAIAENALDQARARASRANAQMAGSFRSSIQRERERAVGTGALQEDYASLQRTLVAAEAAAANARDSLREALLAGQAPLVTASVLASAVPFAATSTDPLRKTFPLGAVVGLLLGGIGALLLEEISPRLRRARSAVASLGMDVLAWVPSARAQERRLSRKRAAPNNGSLAASKALSLSPQGGRVGRIGRILVNAGVLRPEQADDIAAKQASLGLTFGATGIHLGYVSEVDVDRALDEQFGHGRLSRPDGQPARFVINDYPEHPVAEAVRELRTRLLLDWRSSGPRRAISVHSVLPGEGKSFIATNLAIAFVQAKLRTILVDLNLRSPHLHALFGVSAPIGASRMLADPASPDVWRDVDALGRLALLPAGTRPPNPQELLSSDALPNLLRRLETEFDVVIVDCPAWSCGGDAQLIAAVTDAVIVTRAGHTRMDQVLDMSEQMDRLGVRRFGVVANER